jgi:glycerate kinase
MTKKFLLVPDSFKGTMDSSEICDIMKQSIRTHYPDAEIISIPVADGGEGSVDSFVSALNGRKQYVTVKGPFFEPVDAFYGIIDGATAVIEMAACAGLPLAGDHLDPCAATTYGVGELIAHAVKSGCKKVIVGLGGSSTNDAGAGMAAALGVKFLDEEGNEFVPVGGTLSRINRIDLSNRMKELDGVEIITMCDIDNPLYGTSGAAYVFGPQKGADEATVQLLDEGLKNISSVIQKDLKQDVSTVPGSGAAGGMGAGMVAFLGSRLQMGIETVLDTVHFDTLLKDADMVFTGEGKLDTQSLRGKVVIGVARRAGQAGVPVIAVVGDIGDKVEAVYSMGVTAVFSINRVAVDFKKAKLRSKDDLHLTMEDVMRLLRVTNF